MLAPVLATAAALLCQGQLAPPTKAEQRQAALEYYAERRAEVGFRSDIPYIQELIRRGVWEYDVGDIPVTPAENRYLRLRDRLDLGRRAYRYLRKRRDLSGGISVEDDWPRGPYLLVRVTRDAAAHAANLRRLARFPRNLRVVQVRWSERQLRRVANRIDPDLKELEAAGFELSSWGPDISTNTVEVELITKRTDHTEYFAARYGPVTTTVIATEPTRLECAEASAYRISDTGRSLVLGWGASGDAEPSHIELTEHADRVEVGIVQRLPSGGQTDDFVGYQLRVALSAPLGERAVIDAATGLRLRQRGPSPGEPPCPRARVDSPLDEQIALRREEGLPYGRAYVRRILRRRGVPFTPGEQRFLSARAELAYDQRVDAYVDRHRDEFGGSEVDGRFPGRPYLRVWFTRRVAFHRRNLERLVPVRVVRGEYTLTRLRKVEAQIQRAYYESAGFVDGWGDDGILIRQAHVDGNRVVLEVVTTRDDSGPYFRERYGGAVRTVVVGRRHECT